MLMNWNWISISIWTWSFPYWINRYICFIRSKIMGFFILLLPHIKVSPENRCIKIIHRVFPNSWLHPHCSMYFYIMQHLYDEEYSCSVGSLCAITRSLTVISADSVRSLCHQIMSIICHFYGFSLKNWQWKGNSTEKTEIFVSIAL